MKKIIFTCAIPLLLCIGCETGNSNESGNNNGNTKAGGGPAEGGNVKALYQDIYAGMLEHLNNSGDTKAVDAVNEARLLNVSCLAGEASCSDGERPICYVSEFDSSELDDFIHASKINLISEYGNIFDDFIQKALPVCAKADEPGPNATISTYFSNTPPSCGGGIPVCTYYSRVIRDVRSLISTDLQVECVPSGGTSRGPDGVVCPFGGKPVCLGTDTANAKAYCVNDENLIFSGNTHAVSCSDGSVATCVSLTPN